LKNAGAFIKTVAALVPCAIPAPWWADQGRTAPCPPVLFPRTAATHLYCGRSRRNRDHAWPGGGARAVRLL